MRQVHYERYIREAADKTARAGRIAALLAIAAIILFYWMDLYDLKLRHTLPWRSAGMAGALIFLLGRQCWRTAHSVILLHAIMLSGFILMMNGIAYLIFAGPASTSEQEFAVTVGCMTVWLVIAMIANGARKYMVYAGIALMVGLGIFLLAGNARSFGYIFSIYLTAFFAIILMNNQEKQEREKAVYLYELEEGEKKIARQRQELQYANENLVSFNYAITHDLKGPLRRAQSFTQLLERRIRSGELDEESRDEFFEYVKSSLSRMNQIMEDLLLLSRIGTSGLEITEVELEPMARSVWEEQAAGYGGRKPELSLQGLGRMQADASLLWHVLSNLISNAVKYSRNKPEPRVEVGAYRDGQQTVLYVSDNGAGFDMKYAEELGKPFKRLHSVQEFEGVGIGLAIVRQVVNMHRGRFWAESAEGEGATFYCAFPDENAVTTA